MKQFYFMFLTMYTFMVVEAVCFFNVDWQLKGLALLGCLTFWSQFWMDCDERKPQQKQRVRVWKCAPRVRVY